MTFQCGAVVWLYLHVNVLKPLEWVCNFLKQLNKASSCPNLSQRKVLLTPKLFYVKYCCTLSHPWTLGEIIIYYPSPWGIPSASITFPMFIIVNLHKRTGEERSVGGGGEGWEGKPFVTRYSPGHSQIGICNFLQCGWSRPQPKHWFDRERTKFDRNVAAKSAMAGMFLEEK